MFSVCDFCRSHSSAYEDYGFRFETQYDRPEKEAASSSEFQVKFYQTTQYGIFHIEFLRIDKFVTLQFGRRKGRKHVTMTGFLAQLQTTFHHTSQRERKEADELSKSVCLIEQMRKTEA